MTLPFSIRTWYVGGRVVANLVTVGWGEFPLSIISCVVDTYRDSEPLLALRTSNPTCHPTTKPPLGIIGCGVHTLNLGRKSDALLKL